MSEIVRGLKELEAKLKKLGENATKELAKALYQEALVEKLGAQRRTPVEFGALRASIEVQRPKVENGEASVAITAGGPAAPYAIYVHENLEAHHDVGEAKFLENQLRESAPNMATRVSARIDLNRMVK